MTDEETPTGLIEWLNGLDLSEWIPFSEARRDALVALIRQSQAENVRLREALVAICDMEDRPYTGKAFDAEAVAACPECQRYEGHPIQNGICDEHRRPFYERERHDAFERSARGYRASSIARAALTVGERHE